MKNELYRELFKPENPDDPQDVLLMNMWKERRPIKVNFEDKIEDGWRIVGVFHTDNGIKVRSMNPDGTRMLLVDADKFLD